jgi:hypothetical protein
MPNPLFPPQPSAGHNADTSFHQKKNQQLDKKMTEASSALGEFTKQYKACQKKVKDAVSSE